jgi:hypothetical protein
VESNENPNRLNEFRHVDWSIHYARIGEFIVEYEKITQSLRFSYNCMLQRDGLKTWKLGELLLYIESVGPKHLALCLESATKILHPKEDDLIAEARAIRLKVDSLAKTRNEIAHGNWSLGPEVVIISDQESIPQKMGIKRKLSQDGIAITELPTLDGLSDEIANARSVVARIRQFEVALTMLEHQERTSTKDGE